MISYQFSCVFCDVVFHSELGKDFSRCFHQSPTNPIQSPAVISGRKMFILGMRQELSAAVVIGKHACFTSMFICVFLCFHVNTSVFFTKLCVSVCHPVFAESMANLQNKLLQQSASIFSHLVVFESFLSRAMRLSILR